MIEGLEGFAGRGYALHFRRQLPASCLGARATELRLLQQSRLVFQPRAARQSPRAPDCAATARILKDAMSPSGLAYSPSRRLSARTTGIVVNRGGHG